MLQISLEWYHPKKQLKDIKKLQAESERPAPFSSKSSMARMPRWIKAKGLSGRFAEYQSCTMREARFFKTFTETMQFNFAHRCTSPRALFRLEVI